LGTQLFGVSESVKNELSRAENGVVGKNSLIVLIVYEIAKNTPFWRQMSEKQGVPVSGAMLFPDQQICCCFKKIMTRHKHVIKTFKNIYLPQAKIRFCLTFYKNFL
jgi:hypothetical protein